MIASLTAISWILGSWVVLFVLFGGVGFFVQRALGRSITAMTDWLDSFWLGWGLVIAVLQILHFVMPIHNVAFVLFVGVGVVGVILQRRELLSVLASVRREVLFGLALGVVLIWFASRAVAMPTAYDTGFRDIQAVMWITSYPIVPGLNNLFSSLAFNQSSYLYDALLNVGVWSGRAYHIAPGLLYGVFITQAVWSARQLVRNRNTPEQIQWSWFVALLVSPYLMFETASLGGITHYLTDASVNMLGFLSVMYLLDFLQHYHPPQHDNRYLIWRLAFVIIIGLTLKQSFIVFGLAIGMLVLVIWLRRGGMQHGGPRLVKIGVPIVLFGMFVMIPWMVRGVVTSGYIAYPQSFGRFDVDWAESERLVKERQEMLATNTRLRYGDPEDVLTSWAWVSPWLGTLMRDYTNFVLPMGILGVALVVYAVGWLRYPQARRSQQVGLWVLIPMLLMMVVWFLTAPNVKYIRYILWINVSIVMMLAVFMWERVALRLRLGVVFAVWGVCMVYFAYLVIANSALVIDVDSDDGLQARPQPPITVFVTDSDLHLNIPDSHIKQCWDIPLPCTPAPSLRIYERVQGELRHGFGLIPRANP